MQDHILLVDSQFNHYHEHRIQPLVHLFDPFLFPLSAQHVFRYEYRYCRAVYHRGHDCHSHDINPVLLEIVFKAKTVTAWLSSKVPAHLRSQSMNNDGMVISDRQDAPERLPHRQDRNG
jgi:hypothetical protein